jgi:hypothetical protein
VTEQPSTPESTGQEEVREESPTQWVAPPPAEEGLAEDAAAEGPVPIAEAAAPAAAPTPEPTPPKPEPTPAEPPAVTWQPPSAVAPEAPPVGAPAAERPEVAVGAAFAGGFALALILRRLAR